jgi:hypothetical protein
LENDQKAVGRARAGGVSIPAMDLIEEWMGLRTNLEVVLNKDNHIKINEDRPELAPIEPEGWVEDIGVGKEWDKVVGYWRFSDMKREGEGGFINTGVPGARGVFTDISKYNIGLEIFGGGGGKDGDVCLQLEASTSPVDPGEEHDKVKILYDVAYSMPIEGSLKGPVISTGGMRATVLRGGPLDIGVYHTDMNRSKFTVEMYCCFDVSDRKDNQCLVMRTLGIPYKTEKMGDVLEDKVFKDTNSFIESLYADGVVWSLCVDIEGNPSSIHTCTF